jgi:hypothetical protein
LEAVRNQSSNEIHEKIGGAAMTGMLDLADILELIMNGLNHGPLANQGFVQERYQDVGHILS